MYAGISGNTQGETNDKNPAITAVIIETFVTEHQLLSQNFTKTFNNSLF